MDFGLKCSSEKLYTGLLQPNFVHANYMLVVYVTHKVQCMLTISIKV